MDAAFFPLDEELGLLPGRHTPRLQEAAARLGAKLPFREAGEEIKCFWRTSVSPATIQRLTHRAGRAAEALERDAVANLLAHPQDPDVHPDCLLLSCDGMFIPLVGGEWREVKTVTLGEVQVKWDQKRSRRKVRTSDLTHFSRMAEAREFEEQSLMEMHRRGVSTAKTVVAVNDGAPWIQSFIDYHRPDAVRIIDFAHALHYVAELGEAVWGADQPSFQTWFAQARRDLRDHPPQRNLSEWTYFGQQVQSVEQESTVAHALGYLNRRTAMLDYPHFDSKGYPIGSGAVESSHRHVVQRRMKGAGMRWAPHNVDPLLALRNLLSNDRWQTGYTAIVAYLQAEKQRARVTPPRPVKPPVTLASVQVSEEPTPPEPPPQPPNRSRRPDLKHPWRRGGLPSSKWSRYRASLNS